MFQTLRRLALVALVATCSVAHAQRFETLDSAFGEDTLIRDYDTGLEWLRFDITRGMSYNDVYAQLDTTFAGFRIASEFSALVHSLNIPVWYLAPSLPAPPQSFIDQVRDMMTMFGAVGDPSSQLTLRAFEYAGGPAIWDEATGTWSARLDAGHPMNVRWTPTGANYENDSVFFYKPDAYPSISVALVSLNPIPEPSTYALLAVGLGALVFAVRRQRRSTEPPAGAAAH